ncbi:MAG: asparagine--tRNA ligase [Defluviitaleaceae bacterium]|nr:asparagine--tRNA ligase [Defluviitaleaceae bacterium]
MYTLAKDIFSAPNNYIGKNLKIGGWIRTLRDSKNFAFIELNDGSFFKSVQVVFDNSLPGYDEIVKLGVGACITADGELVESPGAKQPFELKASAITIEGTSPTDYPLQKKRHTLEFLRTIGHLRPRTNTFAAVFRVRSMLSYAIHKFFFERGYVYIHTPIITTSDCEGGGEMFRVTTLDPANPPRTKEGHIDFSEDFFGKMTHLTVSGQLSVENFVMAMRNVYTFGPTFRAENSNTTRHAAEFWMMEPEIAFAGLPEVKQLVEDMLKYVIKFVLDNLPEEMQFFNDFYDKSLLDRLNALVSSSFASITYTEAIDLLEKADVKFEYPVKWGMDIQTEHERYLCEQVYKGPLFVTDYPKDIKAFYMRMNDDGKTVAATDLLVPGVGEIVGGSAREERLDVLTARMDEMGLPREEYWWYLDLRRYGSVKHAGFGLGLERLIMYVTAMQNIRDVIPAPRTTGSAEF